MASSPSPTHLDLAYDLLTKDSFAEATAEFQQALDTNEIGASDDFAWKEWGWTLNRVGDTDGAIAKLEHGLSLRSPDAEAYNALGSIYSSQKKYDRAVQLYQQAIATDASYADPHLNWGNALARQNNHQDALIRYREAVALSPKSANYREALARSSFALGLVKDGVQAIDDAINLAPTDRALWTLRLTLLAGDSLFSFADEAARKTLLAFPGDPEMLTAVGRLYRLKGADLGAIDCFDKATAANVATPDAPEKLRLQIDIFLERGYLAYNRNDASVAAQQFEGILALQPQNKEAIRMKANLLLVRRRLDEAETFLNRHDEVDAWLSVRADLATQRTNYESAIRLYRSLLDSQPGSVEGLAGILNTLAAQRKFKAARRFWESEILTGPGDIAPSLVRAWAVCLGLERKFKEGIEFCSTRPATDLTACELKINFLRLLRRFEATEAEARSALQRSPGNVTFTLQLGYVLREAAQFDAAMDCYQQVLQIDLRNEAALVAQADLLFSRPGRQLDKAEQTARAGLVLLPYSVGLHTLLGRVLYEKEDLVQADVVLGDAVALSSFDSLDADFLSVEILNRLKRGDEAKERLVALAEKRPNDLAVKNQLGWLFLSLNDSSSARIEFDSILAVDSNDLVAINSLGAACFTEGKFTEGAEVFRRAYQADPFDVAVVTNLAFALVQQHADAEPLAKVHFWSRDPLRKWSSGRTEDKRDRFSEAESLCREAIRLNPLYAQSYTCLGTIAFKRGQMLASEDYLKASLRTSPKDGGYTDLGALYVHMGRYEDAQIHLQKAVAVSRADSRARIELGNLYLETNRQSEAIRLFREAVDIDRGSPEPPRALALALQSQGDFTGAERVLRQAIRQMDDEQSWQLQLTLAQLLTELADKGADTTLYDEALKALSKIVPCKPRNPEIFFRAGIVWFRLESYFRAVKSFQQCLDLDPNHVGAERNLRIARNLIREQRPARSAFWLGLVLGVICLAGVGAVWFFYFSGRKQGQVSAGMLETLTPTLLAIAAAGFLFPHLIKLKLPGVEAELSQPAEKISKGVLGSLSK